MALVLPQQMLQNNYPDAAGSANTIGGSFHLDPVTNSYLGSMAMAENTDGSITMWIWDDSFATTNVNLAIQFAVEGALDFTADSSYLHQVISLAVISGNYSLTSQSNYNTFFSALQRGQVLTPYRDSVEIAGVSVFRARLYPTSGPGTSFLVNNIDRYVQTALSSQAFSDGVGVGFTPLVTTVLASTAVPTLNSIAPAAADILTTITLVGENITGGYGVYFGDTQTPGNINSFSTSSITAVVPSSLVPGAVNVFLYNGTYQSNALPITVTSNSLQSGLSREVMLEIAPALQQQAPPTLQSVQVVPNQVFTSQYAPVILQALGTFSDGSSRLLADPDDNILWTVGNAFYASIGSESGVLVAENPGVVKAFVASTITPTISASSVINISQYVNEGPLVSLQIMPQKPSTPIGTNVQFYAIGHTASQQVYPPVKWSLVNGAATCSITEDGLVTPIDLAHVVQIDWWQGNSGQWLPTTLTGPLPSAPTTTTYPSTVNFKSSNIPPGIGPHYFYARLQGWLITTVAGTYTIGVNSCDGANLFLNAVPLITSLGTVQAAATGVNYTQSASTGFLAAGTRIPLIVEWGYSTGNSAELQLIWTPPGQSPQVVPNANLEGDLPGEHCTVTCTATDGSGLSSSTDLIVTAIEPQPGPDNGVTTLVVYPKNVTCAAGESIQFTAIGYDIFGSPQLGVISSWSVLDVNGTGIIDPNSGVFTGQLSGDNVIVTATTTTTAGQISGNGQVMVVAGPPVRIAVQPDHAFLQTGTSKQFVAVGFDAFGNTILLAQNQVAWQVIGNCGTVNQLGLFTAASFASQGRLYATYLGSQTLTNYASVNVLAQVGGPQVQSTPQEPFAKVTIHDTVSPPIVVDTRSYGGGLATPNAVPLQDDFWWDLTSFDGLPFQLYGVYVAAVLVPATISQIVDFGASQDLIESILQKYGAPNYLGLVYPSSLIPQDQV